MKRIYLNTTRSICPSCKTLVDATVFASGGKVYMEKACPEHGLNTALISGDHGYYKNAHAYIKPGRLLRTFCSDTKKGCPHDCGLCPEHEQHVCTPIIEITGRCNLTCPICIAAEPARSDITFDELKGMVERLLASEGTIDVLNISGGEPTMHPEYLKFIEYLAAIPEITAVSVSTNGLAFVENDELLAFHREKSVLPALQLDGRDDAVYRKLRGADLFAAKERIVERLVDGGVRFTLIAVMARGVNDDPDNVRYVYDLFMKNESILSLMFQPLVYNDRLGLNNRDRVTIPDVASLVARASGGAVAETDFMPLPCSNANCFALTHLIQAEGKSFLPFKRFIREDRYAELIKNKSLFGTDEESFNEIRDLIFDLWADADGACGCSVENSKKALKSVKSIIKEIQSGAGGSFSPKKSFAAAAGKIKSIYIHHFMDADTFDLTRVRRCCTVYPKTDGMLYPLCSFNNLYRRG